jgi:Protein of unknown function (DUF429)
VHRIGCRSGSPPAKRFRSCDKPWPRDGSVWPRARLPGVRCFPQESRLRKASTSHVTSSRRRLLDRGRGRLFCGLDGAIARVNEGEGGAELRLRLLPRFADVLCAAEAPAMIAVDIPIGLPAPAGRGGLAAENMRGRFRASGSPSPSPFLSRPRPSSLCSVAHRIRIARNSLREGTRKRTGNFLEANSEAPRDLNDNSWSEVGQRSGRKLI